MARRQALNCPRRHPAAEKVPQVAAISIRIIFNDKCLCRTILLATGFRLWRRHELRARLEGRRIQALICLLSEKVQRLKGLTFRAFFIMLRRGMEAGRLTLTVSLHDVSNQSGLSLPLVGASGYAAPHPTLSPRGRG